MENTFEYLSLEQQMIQNLLAKLDEANHILYEQYGTIDNLNSTIEENKAEALASANNDEIIYHRMQELSEENKQLQLQITALRECKEEDAKHFWQLKADFKTACDKADEWKAEALKAFAQNREFAKENQALVSQLEIKVETVDNV